MQPISPGLREDVIQTLRRDYNNRMREYTIRAPKTILDVYIAIFKDIPWVRFNRLPDHRVVVWLNDPEGKVE